MKEWEYVVESWDGIDMSWLRMFLNREGMRGWEVVCIHFGQEGLNGVVVLKR